jgi:Na+-driven multidrug efflux pump
MQEAFSQLLGEQNELTQELASHGMSIVYELGDAAMKQNLVNALVSNLIGSGKRKRAIKVSSYSNIFSCSLSLSLSLSLSPFKPEVPMFLLCSLLETLKFFMRGL